MAPEQDPAATTGSDADVEEASAATVPDGSAASEDAAGADAPSAIAGANPDAAAIPPQGEPPADADKASDAADAAGDSDDLEQKAAEDIKDAEADAELVDGKPETAEEAAAPADHPEPVPVSGIGALQDNVSEPGVEKTTKPGGDSVVESRHDTVAAPPVAPAYADDEAGDDTANK